jgi:hypothetical protein
MPENDYITSLNTKHDRIVNNLHELQAVEEYLFQKIQDASASNDENSDKDDLSNYINSLITQRQHVLSDLGNLYNKANDNIDANTNLMSSQGTMASQLRKEIEQAKIKEKSLIAEKNNKQRLAQIGEYEYSKNSEHRSVLKTLVYSSFFILIIIFLNSKDIFPNFLTKIIVTIIIFITVYILISRVYWNFNRNNIDYSKFNFPKKEKETEDPEEYVNDLTFGKLLGIECKQSEEDSINLEDLKPLEGFSLLNVDSCKCSKNVFPINNLKNQNFKNTTLKYSTVN